MGTRIEPATIVCAVCNRPFVTTATHAKNCADCREIATKKAKRRYEEKRMAERKEIIKETGDAPWQRELCLSCELPDCDGWCDKLKGV